MKTQAELAHRIRNAKPTDPSGRYDMASKVEVKAYLAEEVENAVFLAFKEITAKYEARIAELELSFWGKIKRAWKKVFGKTDFEKAYHAGKGPSEVV